MHYNHFTIDYLNAIKVNLKIDLDSDGNAIFFPDKIHSNDILNLKTELQSIWINSESAISIVKSKQDAAIQSGLFGLVNDMDTALKVGFLLGNRVVLIDYLFERLLQKNPDRINLIHLGVIASSLVNTLPLAEKGRIVIIPTPFNWNPDSKKIIQEVGDKTTLTVDLMSLLNMLSITKICNLHPFTIAESNELYSSIIKNQIDNVDAIGRDTAEFAYDGILGALLSEKLLQETELKIALNLPLTKYFDIISSNNGFYLKYLAEITAGGSLSGQNNIDNLKDTVIKTILERNDHFSTFAKEMTIIGGVGSAAFGVLGLISVTSAPLFITISLLMALSVTLTGLVKNKDNGEQSIISVFKKLHNG